MSDAFWCFDAVLLIAFQLAFFSISLLFISIIIIIIIIIIIMYDSYIISFVLFIIWRASAAAEANGLNPTYCDRYERSCASYFMKILLGVS